LLKTVEELPKEEMVEFRSLFKPYKLDGIFREMGYKFYYPIDDKLYEVVLGHTPALEWKPPENITLYKEIFPPGFISNWIQPLGAGYEYQIGNKVYHNGKKWICDVANNVWEPGVYGWTEIN
jgi:hypothetical protein